jgi:5-methylcytosine-specific restriction endonuclease McrA
VPVKVSPALVSGWNGLLPVVSDGELLERYAVFNSDVDFILSFIESGAPRNKRRGKHYTYAREIRTESNQNNCNICLALLIDVSGECRYDWDLRTIEHIISLDWGGNTTPENSVILCKSCNEAFDHMISGLLPGRITLNKHGKNQKLKNDMKRKRIRTPQQVANFPENWKLTIHLQYIFQRVVVLSTDIAKRDFSEHWDRFVEHKLNCIAGSNKSMLKLKPDYIPRKFDGFGTSISDVNYYYDY